MSSGADKVVIGRVHEVRQSSKAQNDGAQEPTLLLEDEVSIEKIEKVYR